MSDLIDTTEMYLRTVYELQEEGIVPMRARIAERLGQSGPTVSQTVARMQRDGLLVVSDDRHLELTPAGQAAAVRVMRKHRLAECLLVQILGLPWEEAHAEACRWEHVISETVEQRIVELLDYPTISPYGNPIPGLAELLPQVAPAPSMLKESQVEELRVDEMVSLSHIASDEPIQVIVRRIAEPIQDDADAMSALHRVGGMPGSPVLVRASAHGVCIGEGAEAAELSHAVAMHVLVQHGAT